MADPAMLSYWIFQPYVWVILGLSILIIDIFLGFILLPFGISSLIISGLMYSDKYMLFGDFIFFETWQDILVYFAVLSLCSVGIVRFVFQKNNSDKPDINQY